MAATNAENGVPSGETMMMRAFLIIIALTVGAASQTKPRSAWQNCITVNNMPCTKTHLHWPLPETTIPSPIPPPVGHIQCWQAERSGSNSHLMCGDSWGSVVDVSEALEKKHQQFCKAIPNSNGAQVCNGATWHP